MHAFRGDARAGVPLHPLERGLVVLASLQLVFMPWALGTMHEWSQRVSLGLAVVAFIVALIPRTYTETTTRSGDFRLIMWPKLVRFPIFWLGLAFLGYIVLQACNPAWTFFRFPNGAWTLKPLAHTTWLPTSIAAPFDGMNAWRMLGIYGAAWLLACALWVGVTRRSAVQALLTVLAVNGAALGLIAILQRVTGTHEILWFVEGKPRYFIGTFIYKNHGAAYFNLILTVCAALVAWHFARTSRRLERASAAPFFVFCGIVVGVAVIVSFSRGGTILLLGFTLLSTLLFVIWLLRFGQEGRSIGVVLTLCVVFAIFTGMGAYYLKLDRAYKRLETLLERGAEDSSVDSRQQAFQATWDMAEANLVTGWGAGGFRHMFPRYQQHYPDIWSSGGKRPRHYFWEYAHNDYLQGLAEVGLIGAGLVLAMIGSALTMIGRVGGFGRLPVGLLLAGIAMTLAHSAVDFHFYNPAILTTWCALWILAARWAELESRRSGG